MVPAIFFATFFVSNITSAATPTAQEFTQEMKTLVNQYSEKIRLLEAENALLKSTLAKNGVSVPLDEYNKIYATSSGNTSPVAVSTSTKDTKTSTTNASTTQAPVITASGITDIQKWFINRFRKDWPDIRKAYGFPVNATIGGYEFVKNETGKNVFVDLVFGTGTLEWAYNAKLLYEFDKNNNFSRKLVGLFDYISASKAYTTRKWTNPFAALPRDIIREYGNSVVAVTPASTQAPSKVVSPSNSGTTSTTTTNSGSVTPKNDANTGTTATVSPVKTPESTLQQTVEAKVLDAYGKRDWATLTQVSDEYLKNNAPTYKIMLYRYRMFFLNRDFAKSLEEIKKMEQANLATPLIYCDAYAVSLYAKNDTLANTYKNLAGSGCKLN